MYKISHFITFFCTLNRHKNLVHLKNNKGVLACNFFSDLGSNRVAKPGINKGTNLAYSPKDVEEGWYHWWESKGFFTPKANTTSKQFNILLPPPNVTGTLHLGHALTATLQDVLARWHRMQGHPVSWVPGTDHAGIATQVVVEKKLLREEGKTRHDVGRERFIEEVWKWKHEKGGLITSQLRCLGASLDWSKEYFTMDNHQSAAVSEAFIRLHALGLVYRSNSLVNWSCNLRSAISDIEVDWLEVAGPTLISVPGYQQPVEFGVIQDFAYKLCDKEGEVVVSTTRIETMLGDVAVAVHPDDERYTHLHGSFVWHPFRRQRIPVIPDSFVDPHFGTGAVKLTPAHDMKDFEASKKHGLDVMSVIAEDGNMNDKCGPFIGMPRFSARTAISSELNKLGLLRDRRPHSMQLPICSRSGDVVELLLKPQWFINCRGMAELAVAAVRSGELVIEPPQFQVTWFHWLENIRDWCVSRQLWWGHRVPMYECFLSDDRESSVWLAAASEVGAREQAAARFQLSAEDSHKLRVIQDEDVLDTWFSSALLPFTVFGWPKQTEDLERFYPLTLMETGHDILFFWVARMVMLGQQLTGQLPFNDLQRQAELSFESGVMSQADLVKAVAAQEKAFPNGIPECGTDALRFTLCSHNIKNHFINFDVSECHTNRLFCNKLWQASKYVALAVEKRPPVSADDDRQLGNVDRWILSRLAAMVTEVNRGIESCNFHLATSALKSFIYYDFCDVYLECTKQVLRGDDSLMAGRTCHTLLSCLHTCLLSLSPFMPFVCEQLYQQLSLQTHDSIMLASLPTSDQWSGWRNEDLEKEMEFVLEIVTTVRRLKKMCGITKQKPTIRIVSTRTENVGAYCSVIASLAHCSEVTTSREGARDLDSTSVAETVGSNCSVHLITQGEVMAAAKDTLGRKQKKIEQQLDKLIAITTRQGYSAKASEHVQKTNTDKILALRGELKRLEELDAVLPNR